MHRSCVILSPVLLVVNVSGVAHAADTDVVLAPHRAVYDLKLLSSRGQRSLQSVRGRILYDFSGSPCEGYTLQFRQVTDLDSGEGKTAVADLRASNWEAGDGKSFRFVTQTFSDGQASEAGEGKAEQRDGKVSVQLTKPQTKTFEATPLVFPSAHTRAVIAAARDGKTLLETPLYDGSESGERVYNTLSVIGPAIPAATAPNDAAAGQQALASLARWPVTVSYFERDKATADQTPAYSISFEVYDNGLSRALKLDYGDFVLAGELTSLEMKPAKPCS